MQTRPLAARLLVVSCITPSLLAQSPTIAFTNPLAVAPGTTTVVEVHGNDLADATTLWTSFPAEVVLDDSLREGNRARFNVNVPAEVAPGLYGLRVVSPHGLSAVKLVTVDDLPSVATARDNDARERAQVLDLPVAVDGHVDPLKTRWFRFQAEAGQRLSFEVLARRSGSALDPMIRLLDAAGHELVYSDDEPGLVGDARLRHEFTTSGDYVLELRDIKYAGGGNHLFRLRIGDFPCIDTPLPMAARRGTEIDLRFAGPHAEGLEPQRLLVPKDPALDWLPVAARFPGGTASGFATLALSDEPQTLETEPNDDLASANEVELAGGWNGQLGEPRDVDHFRFTAKKDETRRFEAITRRQGSAADLYLRLLDANGKQLAVAEDSGSTDGLLTQKFPADGEYVLAVEDLNRRGGPQFAYRVVVTTAAPPFTLAAARDNVEIPATGVGALPISVARAGYDGMIELAATNLPDGLASDSVVIGAGRNSAILTLRTHDAAHSGRVFPLTVVGRAAINGQPFETAATVGSAIRSANANVPYPPPILNDSLALSVTPESPFTLDVAVAPVTFGPQLAGKLKVTARRREGFDEAITLAVEPAKDGLPPNVTAALAPIPKGQVEVEITFNATDKAALGRFSTVLRGTMKQGDTTVTQFTPAIALDLAKPYTLAVTPTGGTLKKGEELTLTVTIDRNPSLAVPVELQVDNLPPGVELERIGLPAADDTVTLVLAADKDAPGGSTNTVHVTGKAKLGESELVERTPNFEIKVE